MRCALREEIRKDNRILALASVGAGAIYFLVIIVILNAYIDNKRRQKELQLIRVIRDMKERMAMDEVHYLISDASRKVDVEAHVLRYWEEELELGIPRNEMGHRYYTDFHIRLFKQVKNLKEKGYQLKVATMVVSSPMAMTSSIRLCSSPSVPCISQRAITFVMIKF